MEAKYASATIFTNRNRAVSCSTSFDSSKYTTVYHHDNGFGTDTITVEVFSGGVNRANRRLLTSATATVQIEDKKDQIVYGCYFTEVYETADSAGNPRVLITDSAITPRVKDAKSYSVRCSGFNDKLYYGTSYTAHWSEPVNLPDKAITHYADAATATEIWHSNCFSNSTGMRQHPCGLLLRQLPSSR